WGRAGFPRCDLAIAPQCRCDESGPRCSNFIAHLRRHAHSARPEVVTFRAVGGLAGDSARRGVRGYRVAAADDDRPRGPRWVRFHASGAATAENDDLMT